MADSETFPSTKPGQAADVDSLGSMLCTQCGLCCMGVIHNNAVLDPDEIPAAEQLGLTVRDGDRPVFALPCPRLAGTVCTIYADRPRVCGRYKCQVLQDLEGQHKSLDEALALVASAKDLLMKARAVMPDTMPIKEAKALAQKIPEPAAVAGLQWKDLMELRLRVTALELHLDRHFRNSKDLKALELAPLQSAPEEMT